MELFPLFKNVSKFLVITLHFYGKNKKNLLLRKYLNRKLLVQLIAGSITEIED